jgi:hypothetical protein
VYKQGGSGRPAFCYTIVMRYLALILTLMVVASPAEAFNPIAAEPAEQYAVIPVEGDPYVERTYLGDLEDAPDLYEFSTDVAISVRIQVLQRDSKKAVPFGLIMVRQNDTDGGVEEIVRLQEPLESWSKERWHMLGMTFLAAPVLQVDIKPGTYRIEVSTPDNKGTYALTIGEETSWPGYFKSLWQIVKTQHHFGLTPFHALQSVLVFATLGVVGIGYGTYWLRQRRKETHELTS